MPRKSKAAKHTRTARTSGAYVEGNVRADRDVILGDQYNLADLASVVELLEQIVALLGRPESHITIESIRDVHNATITIEGDDTCVTVSPADVARLGVLRNEPGHREAAYLARFALDEVYARWERDYLPLGGTLADAPQPGAYLRDPEDPSIGAQGRPLDDVRQALEQLGKPRLVILGEPGAGKTVTLHRLALDLARACLRDPAGRRLPFRVDLYEFKADERPGDFLEQQWEQRGPGVPFAEAIRQGRLCFLLDGLNQMPSLNRHDLIDRWRTWVRDQLGENWAVFTCRVADYLPNLGLPEVRVSRLDKGRMRRYLELRLGPERAAVVWTDFAVRLRTGDPRFERLAGNPFMLSLLAERAKECRPLTERRAELLDDLAQRLIGRELTEQRQPDELRADHKATVSATFDALARLAFAAQVASGEGGAFSHALAERTPLAEGPLSLDDILGLACDATVLDRTRDGYVFYHHLLHEYFAGRELLRRFRAGENLGRLWGVPWRVWQFWPQWRLSHESIGPPPVTGWEETVRIAAGLAGEDRGRLITAVSRRNLPLAGRCLTDVGVGHDDLHSHVTHTQCELLARQRNRWAHLRARIDAGRALGELGHPDLVAREYKFEGSTVWAVEPPLQTVAAGAFLRGSVRGTDGVYSDEYTSERSVMLPAYAIGRYTVTNAEYRFFIDAGGYRDNRWWNDAGRMWKRGAVDAHDAAIQDWLAARAFVQKQDFERWAHRWNMRPEERQFWKDVERLSDEQARDLARQWYDRPFDRPAYWDDVLLGNPGHPVVGVNWYEAEAYCRWLSAVTGHEYRLPHESEWEKAARGTDGREYPWGKRFNAARCNTIESHIYSTTPAGLYPDGVSPFGLFDTSGNVWDWTADWYQEYPGGDALEDFGETFKTVRGGSWYSLGENARCAARYCYTPVDFTETISFRVLSPGPISAL